MHRSCTKRLLDVIKISRGRFASNGNEPIKPMVTPDEILSIDDPPTTCCMSGCPNCVYIEWAEALTKKLGDSDPAIARKILDNVADPGMKMFLTMELKSLGYL